nr:hypothetical protein [Tanacetum cinerariifolium]
ELASLSRDDRQGEAFPTVSSLDKGHDTENIAMTSAMPHESSPRVSSLDADESSMQQRLHKLMELCTSLQRQQSQMADKIKDQDLEISRLKARVKTLEDKEKSHEEPIQEDAPITGGIMDIGEELRAYKSTKKGSTDTEEMVNVLSSMEAANILSSGGAAISTASVSSATAGVPTVSGSFPTISAILPLPVWKRESEVANILSSGGAVVSTASVSPATDCVPIVSAIFTTASVVTPYIRRSRGIIIRSLQPMRIPVISAKDKGKEKVTQTEVPKKKKLQEQIDAQMEDFVPMSSKEESERVKRPRIKLDQGSAKRVKISHTSRSEHSQEQQFKGSEGVSKEELKGMMQLVPLEEVYIEALQENKLWVVLKRMFEPDSKDQLWTYDQAFMYDPLDWKLYDTCGVHHVSTKNQEIFMLVEKDYPLRKGHATVMISNKLQVEHYSQMASDLLLKIYNTANNPR